MLRSSYGEHNNGYPKRKKLAVNAREDEGARVQKMRKLGDQQPSVEIT